VTTTPEPRSSAALGAPAVPERRPLSADADLFGLTDRGQVRKENQDQFMIASLHKLLRVHQSSLPADDITPLISDSRGFLFLVADGVGGRPDGQAASGTAVKTIAHYVTHLTDLYRRLDPARESVFMTELQHSVERTHAVLRSESEKEYGGRGGATTLTMVAVLWPRAYMVQVGDSRCYRLRDGELELMSRDQTVAQQLVDSGALSLTEARRSPFQGVLSSALGGREATPTTRSTEIRWDDVMLLCTDGLTKHVSDEEIEAELRQIQSAEASCRNLIKLALERGGTDNVTVVIGRVKRRQEGS
jgi:serine/threonine protein phosphatase PrpC